MVATFAPRLAVALVFLGAGCARADYTESCADLVKQAKISVVFQDRSVLTDESRSIQALNGLSGKRAEGRHSVYGLTRAQPYFRVSAAVRAVMDNDRPVCAVPDISVDLGFSEIVVYLARELTDPCRRSVIRDHEDEHVNTWKAHLRASAQLLTTALQREVSNPRTYASPDEAEAGIRAWAAELVAPWAKRLLDSVIEAQHAIDTPASYAAVEARLRACPRTRR